MANSLYRCTLEFAHLLSHDGIPDHSLASHRDDVGLSHGHDFLQKAQMTIEDNAPDSPIHHSSNSSVKLHLILPQNTDNQLITKHSIPYNRPAYQEVFFPILYISPLIDPPDLG
ncbi:MAG: hypothetical protein AAF985_02525 [Bacteroidota bacterium]